MAKNLLPVPKFQFLDNSGKTVPGGKVFTYAAGTTNKQATFTDSTGSTPNLNPIILDANGRCDIWITSNTGYKIVFSPASDTDPPANAFWTEDQVTAVDITLRADLAASSGSSLVGFTAAGAGAGPRTVQAKDRDLISMLDFAGVDPTGATDSSVGANKFFAALASLASGSTQDGAIALWPKGSYLFSSPVIWTLPNFGRTTLIAGGAEIITSGAIPGLQITGGATGGAATIIGLQINHRGNASATFGFDMPHCDNVTLDRCYVRANGVGAGYAAYHWYNSNAADDSTGSLWNTLLNCGCGKDAGGDTGDIPFSVLIEGASNANLILGGQYGRSVTSGEGVRIQNMVGQTTCPNALAVIAASFEGLLTHIHMSGAAASTFTGMRFIGNRFESGTTVFSLTGSTTQPARPPYMAGNYITGSGGTYLNNPNNILIDSYDLPTNRTWLALRNEEAQGVAVTAANNLVLGSDGNYFQVNGSTQINLISNIGVQGGTVFTLKFNGTPTLKYNQATSGTNVRLVLAGAVDFVAAANNVLTLRYDSTDVCYYEQARKT